jgi:hypothetical protein
MPIWSEDGDYINPAHIVWISRAQTNRHGTECSVLHTIDGKTFRTIGQPDELADKNLSSIVQASPGYEFLHAYGEKPGDPYCYYDVEPIIAWRIGDQEPLPVTVSRAEELSNPHAIRYPDGRVYQSGDGFCLADLNRQAAEAKQREQARLKAVTP